MKTVNALKCPQARVAWICAQTLLALATVALATSCAGKTPRTRWTDKTMRVAIDPASIDAGNYVRIQQALVESGKWVVVDRAMAFRAIKAEQERLHRGEEDRFADKEKWAIWGRLLGVGGIVVAHTQCANKGSFWNDARYAHCHQFLSIVDSNTGEVMATAEDEQDGSNNEEQIAPPWADAVAKLNDAYPTHFQPNRDKPQLEQYRALAAEESQRQRERHQAAPAAPAPKVEQLQGNAQAEEDGVHDIYNQSPEEQAALLKKLGVKPAGGGQ